MGSALNKSGTLTEFGVGVPQALSTVSVTPPVEEVKYVVKSAPLYVIT